MSTTLSMMNQLKGDVLLAGSDILTRIESLKAGLTYRTDETYISFDDRFLKLQAEIDSIPRIQLMETVHPGAAGTKYENELLTALEEIQDQVEKHHIRAISFMGQLTRAQADIEEMAITFESWYILAANEALAATTIKLPASNVKGLAKSEFNRLMGHTNLGIDALVEAIKIEIRRLDSKRKMAAKKFEMGREQVNAAWANKLPESLGHFANAPEFGLLKPGVIEEDYDDVPDQQFIPASAGVEKPKTEAGLDGFTEGVDYARQLTPAKTFCGICGEKQFLCPSGAMCANGHGGAEQLDAPPEKTVQEKFAAGELDESLNQTIDEESQELVDGHDVGNLIPTFLSDDAFDDEPATENTEPGPIDRVIAKRAAEKASIADQKVPLLERKIELLEQLSELKDQHIAEVREILGTFKKTGTFALDAPTVVADEVNLNGKRYFMGIDYASDFKPSSTAAVVVENNDVIEEVQLTTQAEVEQLVADIEAKEAAAIPEHPDYPEEPEPPVTAARTFDFDDFDDEPAIPVTAETPASELKVEAVLTDDFDDELPLAPQAAPVQPKPVPAEKPTPEPVSKPSAIFDFDDDDELD